VSHSAHSWARALAALALALCACRSRPSIEAPPPSTGSARTVASTDRAPAAASADLQPAPAVRVAAEVGADGVVAIRVQNRAPHPVELANALHVEQRTEHGFDALSGSERALREAPAGASCVPLVPGGELRAAPFQDKTSAAQPGTYRVVLHGCDRSYRIDGEPFELH
jgi:hypothetical protein